MLKAMTVSLIFLSSTAFAGSFSCYRIWYSRYGQATSYYADVIADSVSQANAINQQWRQEDPQTRQIGSCYPKSSK